ncbi:TrmB family transcriptional regulator [Halobacteriales archaeon SW_7_68_16]|nr:MAG: TrmB family transcriptional regulator [Halobacteriales archaeon SW_7_68_16]
MSAIELTTSQKTILRALTELYSTEGGDSAIKGERIAEAVDRNPGTIRNQMQSLKALQLVEGVPGPKGGYRPTPNAFEVLDIDEMDEAATVPLYRDGERMPDATVREIDLTSVHHPDLCRAEISVRGSLGDVAEGDRISAGPTPLSKLVVEGVVDSRDDAGNTILVRIEGMSAPAEPDGH